MTLSNPAQYISGRTVQEQMNSLIDYVDQRAADVALDAIAGDVAQVHQDMLDADADAAAAAASAAAAAGTLANAVKKTGEASQSIAGEVNIVGPFSAGVTNLNGATAINADASVVGDLSVSGDTTLSGVTTVLTQTTGVFSNQAASSLKLKNELDAYAPMVRTTGNQTISGDKTFVSNINLSKNSPTYTATRTDTAIEDVPVSTQTFRPFVINDKNGIRIASIIEGKRANNSALLSFALENKVEDPDNPGTYITLSANLRIDLLADGTATVSITDKNGSRTIA